MIRDRIDAIEGRLERLEHPASGTELTPAEREVRQADIRRQLEQLVAERDELERDALEPAAGRSSNAGVSGSVERQRHDRLLGEIETLERELVTLEI